MSTHYIDMNSDLGESYGPYVMGNDEEMMDYVTSANVACGFHAGDYMVMAKTVENAIKKNVAVGAHPGYPDVQGFGRRSIKYTPEEVKNMILYQIGALDAIVKSKGGRLGWVKNHGQLGNDNFAYFLKGDTSYTEAYAEAILSYNPDLYVFCGAESQNAAIYKRMGLKVVREVFADRAYASEGGLVPRSVPGAIITDPDQVAKRLIDMVHGGCVKTIDGKYLEFEQVDSICFHGDTRTAVELAKTCRRQLEEAGIVVKSFLN